MKACLSPTCLVSKTSPCLALITLWTALLCPFLGATRTSSAEPPADPSQTPAIRVLVLKGEYLDHYDPNAFDPFSLMLGQFEKPASFFALCEKIDELSNNQTIQNVFFDLSSVHLQMNLAQLAELNRHIAALKKSGKKTFAWLQSGHLVHYSIASACDTVLMAEIGLLDLPSLSLTALHFHDAMELLGAHASSVRTGDFKGAVEPFTRSEMSPELRTQYRHMLQTMNQALVERLASGRKLSPDQIRKIQSDRLFTAQTAKEAGLVDQLAPFGTERAAVEKIAGRKLTWIEPSPKKTKPLSFFELMAKIISGGQDRKSTEPTLAVLHLEGIILEGEKERPDAIVAGPMVKEIARLKDDDSIRAVVVRINSPGGSASASEAIRSELDQLAKTKPLLVSMGKMAASGGYWISCLRRPVYAEPETITGSIGVFALKLSFAPLLKKIGVRVETVTLDDSATAMSLARPWSPAEEKRIELLVKDIYNRFLKLVADSRKLDPDKLPALAEGRVWSGQQAHANALVDHLGGLDDALAAAAKEARLSPGYRVLHRPRPKTFFEMFNFFEENEIQQSLAKLPLNLLQNAGFDLAIPIHLLRAELSAPTPQLWLLSPFEILIR